MKWWRLEWLKWREDAPGAHVTSKNEEGGHTKVDAQAAYKIVNQDTTVCEEYKVFVRQLIEALTGEEPKAEHTVVLKGVRWDKTAYKSKEKKGHEYRALTDGEGQIVLMLYSDGEVRICQKGLSATYDR